MRPDRVRRASHLLTSLLLLAATGFAVVVSHEQTPETGTPHDAAPAPVVKIDDGSALFTQRCARCHDLTELTGPLQMQMDREQARSDLQAFLNRHRHASAAENEVLAAWLVAQ